MSNEEKAEGPIEGSLRTNTDREKREKESTD
jgi:hypothetical protein